MKALIATLMFVSTVAHAQTSEWVARIPNKAGGTIVFLTIAGSCQTGKAVYGSTSSGLTSWGCWINSDNHVMVFWNDGETRTSAFPYSALEINPIYLKKARDITF
jgi:hypothetical protein